MHRNDFIPSLGCVRLSMTGDSTRHGRSEAPGKRQEGTEKQCPCLGLKKGDGNRSSGADEIERI